MQRVPILMYHDVTPRPHPSFRKYAVTPAMFAAQMRWLAIAGYSPVGLDALLAHRDGGTPLPKRAVVITFDDGFRDCVEHAAPVLASHAFTATFYLVSGLLGGTSGWLLRERGIELPLASGHRARALCAAGFTCGAHTVSHPRLAALSDDACREELVRSRQMLEDELGTAVVHLAYPFGSFDARVRDIAEKTGYRSACTVRTGLSADGDDPLALPRVPVNGGETLADFACRLRTGHSATEVMRWKAGAAWSRLVRLGAHGTRRPMLRP